jgi:hypothetical protein
VLPLKRSLRQGGEEYPAEAFAKGGNSDEQSSAICSSRAAGLLPGFHLTPLSYQNPSIRVIVINHRLDVILFTIHHDR